MKQHNVEQNSVEWFALRCALPTASMFEKILTPTGKLSTQSVGYMNRFLAEALLGYQVLDKFDSEWMIRGRALEPEAVTAYEFHRDITTEKAGFFTNNEGTFGASPDRLIGEDGLLEVKCLAPQNHVAILRSKDATDYFCQIQGQLLVTERKWCDLCAYHPELPLVVIRVERDEEYIAKLSAALKTFTEQFKTELERIKQ